MMFASRINDSDKLKEAKNEGKKKMKAEKYISVVYIYLHDPAEKTPSLWDVVNNRSQIGDSINNAKVGKDYYFSAEERFVCSETYQNLKLKFKLK